MKTRSALLPSIGALLALLLFVALPTPSAHASQGQCPDVDISWYYAGGNQIYFEVEVGSGCDIYVTNSVDNPNFAWPSRSGATPIYPTIKVASGSTFYIPYGHTMYIRAFAWKPAWTQSVNITTDEQHNPNL
jgi:hypothetical protein